MTLRTGASGPLVAELQSQLLQLGFRLPAPTGIFGELTEAAVRDYQQQVGLPRDGVVGQRTAAALASDCAPRPPELATFRGRLGFVAVHEGHRGRPYWPGAASGVTLDPGGDLRFMSRDRLMAVYGPILSLEALEALELAIGAGPKLARELVHDPAISRVRISRAQAARALPRLAGPYWLDCLRAAPALGAPDMPATVHTAALDVAYSLGADDLAPLAGAIAARDWSHLARSIAAIPKLRPRRAAEAALLAG